MLLKYWLDFLDIICEAGAKAFIYTGAGVQLSLPDNSTNSQIMETVENIRIQLSLEIESLKEEIKKQISKKPVTIQEYCDTHNISLSFDGISTLGRVMSHNCNLHNEFRFPPASWRGKAHRYDEKFLELFHHEFEREVCIEQCRRDPIGNPPSIQ